MFCFKSTIFGLAVTKFDDNQHTLGVILHLSSVAIIGSIRLIDGYLHDG